MVITINCIRGNANRVLEIVSSRILLSIVEKFFVRRSKKLIYQILNSKVISDVSKFDNSILRDSIRRENFKTMREFRNVIRTIIITFRVTVSNDNFKVIFVLTREALCPPFHGMTLVRKFNDL